MLIIKRLCGARVVTESAYGILRGRWQILYKKIKCRLFDLHYVTMACIALHNLCIELADPCQPRLEIRSARISTNSETVTKRRRYKGISFKSDENIQLVIDGSLMKVKNIH